MNSQSPASEIPPQTVTFAVAEETQTAIVCVAMASKLSRLFLWDLGTDKFTPGQFIKSRAYVLSISPDGKYFAYMAWALHRRAQVHMGIAKPPYFTALAFFPVLHPVRNGIEFVSSERVIVDATRDDQPWVEGYDLVQERVEPGCPLTLERRLIPQPVSPNQYHDVSRRRTLSVDGHQIVSSAVDNGQDSIICTFQRETFESIEAPEWAKRW